MRELKFRAWDKLKKRICRVISISPNDDGTCAVQTLFASFMEASIVGDNYPVRFELMQFTGLKDKNGTEIYEGDILECTDCDGTSIGLVRYSGASFSILLKSDFVWELNLADSTYKKIGNIYENPELLEDK